MATKSPYPVVVGIGFDVPSTHAFREALRIAADRPGTVIHLLHATPSTARSTRGSGKSLAHAAATLEDVPQRLRAWTMQALDALDDRFDVAIIAHARIGDAADALLQLSVDVDAELILVGTHARRGARRIVLGSVAEKIVRIARCPVLVAHPKTYSGLAHSPQMEPLCDDCARVRVESGGTQLWCAEHASHTALPHIAWWAERLSSPGHNPSIIP